MEQVFGTDFLTLFKIAFFSSVSVTYAENTASKLAPSKTKCKLAPSKTSVEAPCKEILLYPKISDFLQIYQTSTAKPDGLRATLNQPPKDPEQEGNRL